MIYGVTFTQRHYYEVEAENETEAEDLAYQQFYSDVSSSVANTHIDEAEIEEVEEEE